MPSYKVSPSQLIQLNGNLDQVTATKLSTAINEATAKYSVDQSARRVRYFVAQSFFETQGYTKWEENLNYSTAARLVQVWPSRFTLDSSDKSKAYAPSYIGNPEKLASLVYANQYGNGDQESGDGWLYRGRGAFHLTFKANYTQCSQDVYGDHRFVAYPDLVGQVKDAFISAGWFWNKKGLNSLADSDSFTQVTKIINGSTVTVPQRIPVLNKVNSALTWNF